MTQISNEINDNLFFLIWDSDTSLKKNFSSISNIKMNVQKTKYSDKIKDQCPVITALHH